LKFDCGDLTSGALNHRRESCARRAAFEEAYQSLKKRIEAFLALPLETLSRDEVLAAARKIHGGD